MRAAATSAPTKGRRDYRPLALLVVVTAVLAIGVTVELLPGRGVDAAAVVKQGSISAPAGLDKLREIAPNQTQQSAPAENGPDSSNATTKPSNREINELLRSAEKSIRAGHYDEAIAIINRAGPLNPEHAPTYLTMGHALAGKRDYEQARRYYESAINFDPLYADAYFAHAAASEQLNDLETALGGMRSFLHTVKNPDPYRLQVAQARSAIWEWEAKLGRGPWGKTGGVPPGFTAAELRRDGKGMGTKMPVPNNTGTNGLSQYEIKYSDKFNLFKP